MRLVQWREDRTSECGRFKVTCWKVTDASLPRWCLWGKVEHQMARQTLHVFSLLIAGPTTKTGIKQALKKYKDYEIKVMK